jgi:hypothetical protein
MSRRPATFRESDIRRVLRAARAEHVRVRIEIERDGRIVITTGKEATGAEPGSNEWDEVLK